MKYFISLFLVLGGCLHPPLVQINESFAAQDQSWTFQDEWLRIQVTLQAGPTLRWQFVNQRYDSDCRIDPKTLVLVGEDGSRYALWGEPLVKGQNPNLDLEPEKQVVLSYPIRYTSVFHPHHPNPPLKLEFNALFGSFQRHYQLHLEPLS